MDKEFLILLYTSILHSYSMYIHNSVKNIYIYIQHTYQ